MDKGAWSGKVAIVTGGGSGIGREICSWLGKRGAVLFVVDRDRLGAEETAAAVVAAGGRASAAQLDVTEAAAVEELVARAASATGRLDFIFNNAGISVNGEFQDIGIEDWRHVLDVDLWGVIHGCRAAYPLMMRQGSGHIVNTASLAGLIPGSLTSPYSAAKHAVVGFSLTLRAEASLHGIRVSALCPGYLRTPIHASTPVRSPFMLAERNLAMNARMRFPGPADCVDSMMRGVERNRAVIVSPPSQSLYWWLYRLAPSLVPASGALIIKKMKDNARTFP